MTGHATLILILTAATEASIAISAGATLRARHRARRAATQAQEQAAELRAQGVDDAIATDDHCALLVALGLIPDPELEDLPRRDAAELQALIYPADIVAGGAR